MNGERPPSKMYATSLRGGLCRSCGVSAFVLIVWGCKLRVPDLKPRGLS